MFGSCSGYILLSFSCSLLHAPKLLVFSTFFLCLKESLYFQSFKLEIREIKTYRVMREGGEGKRRRLQGCCRCCGGPWWAVVGRGGPWWVVARVCVYVNIFPCYCGAFFFGVLVYVIHICNYKL